VSKTIQKAVIALLRPSVVAELDALRGDISRSKMIERAVVRLVEDMREGNVNLLPEVIKTKEELLAEEAATSQK
jgi:hypothetical protein